MKRPTSPVLLEQLHDISYYNRLSKEEKDWLQKYWVKPALLGDFREVTEQDWPTEKRREVRAFIKRMRTDKHGKGGDALVLTLLTNQAVPLETNENGAKPNMTGINRRRVIPSQDDQPKEWCNRREKIEEAQLLTELFPQREERHMKWNLKKQETKLRERIGHVIGIAGLLQYSQFPAGQFKAVHKAMTWLEDEVEVLTKRLAKVTGKKVIYQNGEAVIVEKEENNASS